MTIYSIKDLEKISGIKAHTIRIWEQRYDLLTPMRSDTNIRSYDDDQAKKLLNVSTLVHSGLKISQISKLSPDQITEQLEEVHQKQSQKHNKYFPQIHSMIGAAMNYNEEAFNKELSMSTSLYGFEDTFENVVYPVLKRIGLLWTKDQLNPAQEHFLSNLIKQKLYREIDELPETHYSSNHFVLFLAEWEDHEMGLLYGHYLLKKNGFKVTFLGPKVPAHNLIETMKTLNPDYLLTFLIAGILPETLNKYFNQILEHTKTKLLISGNPGMVELVNPNSEMQVLSDIGDFKDFINFV
jgi:DNA-binding transcriptional MerR regulator